MQYKAESPKEYIKQLPEEKQETIAKLRNTVLENLPNGFEEQMSYDMLGFVVYHSLYPNGYHCDTKPPLYLL